MLCALMPCSRPCLAQPMVSRAELVCFLLLFLVFLASRSAVLAEFNTTFYVFVF